MDDLSTFVKDAYAAEAERPSPLNQAPHHFPVSFFHVFQRKRVKFGEHFIGIEGVFYGNNVLFGPQHALSIDDGGNLLQRESVIFDGKRRLNRPYAIDLAQTRQTLQFVNVVQPAQILRDFKSKL